MLANRGLMISFGLLLCSLTTPVAAQPIVAGPGSGDATILEYSFDYDPGCIVGTPGAGIDVQHSEEAGPIILVFSGEVPGGYPIIGVPLAEHWHIVGPTVYGWHQKLGSYDSDTGWTWTGNLIDPMWPLGLWTIGPEPDYYGGLHDGNAIDMTWDSGLSESSQLSIETSTFFYTGESLPSPPVERSFAVLLHPVVPEPATMSLLALGLGALATRRRRGS